MRNSEKFSDFESFYEAFFELETEEETEVLEHLFQIRNRISIQLGHREPDKCENLVLLTSAHDRLIKSILRKAYNLLRDKEEISVRK